MPLPIFDILTHCGQEHPSQEVQHLQSNAWKAVRVHSGMPLVQGMALLCDVPHGYYLQVILQVAVAELVDGVIVLQAQATSRLLCHLQPYH